MIVLQEYILCTVQLLTKGIRYMLTWVSIRLKYRSRTSVSQINEVRQCSDLISGCILGVLCISLVYYFHYAYQNVIKSLGCHDTVICILLAANIHSISNFIFGYS